MIARLPVIDTLPVTFKKPSRITTLPFSKTATLVPELGVTSLPTNKCVPIETFVEKVLPTTVKIFDPDALTSNLLFVVLNELVAKIFVDTTLPCTDTRSGKFLLMMKSLSPI